MDVRETGVSRRNIGPIKGRPQISQYDSAVMYGGFQRGSQLGLHDAERRYSLFGQLYVHV